MDKFILSYVNAEDCVSYDREFDNLAALRAFVDERHKDATSYQIIVIRKMESSSAVEQRAVNASVAGSIPASSATYVALVAAE